MGAEGEGLRPRVREACDVLARIPMSGRVESLNISVACGLLLYEAIRNTK
jgi:23S rRNA (guanosine2251-2'-O)-methyltransferase